MSRPDELSRLLQAERVEAPPSDAAAKGWLDLASSLEAGVSAMPVATGPLKLGLSALTKWLVGSSITALGVAGTAVALSRPAPSKPPAAVASTAMVAPGPPADARPPAAIEAPPEPRAETDPPAQRPQPPASASAQPSTFADELRLIRLAKQELDAGRPHLAQVWLDEHAHLYPSGVFSGERGALQVLLTCQRSPDAGREAARRFSASNPHSPLLDRISRACGLSGETTPPLDSGKPPDLTLDK
jgi:hypothetical protein